MESKDCTASAFTTENCPIRRSLEVIGGKWKLLILFYLRIESKRYNELRRLIIGISEKMLITELKTLHKHGIIHKEVYNEIPPRVEYSLTDKGKALIPILEALYDYGEKQLSASAK